MAAEVTPLDALVAEMLGDIGKLHDAVGLLTGTITDAGANIQVLVNQLEGAWRQIPPGRPVCERTL